MDNIVNDKLNDEAYSLLDLPCIEFDLGELEFFNKDTINNAQSGFRYNSLTGEKIEGWIGDNYVIVGYDTTCGCGPDPYIVNVFDPQLPVYYLVSDGGDWNNPDLICDSLDKFNKIIKIVSSYSDYLCGDLTPNMKNEIINKISEIDNDVSKYWNDLLDRAMPEDNTDKD